MLWNYNDYWRDKFETCEHRDILIVPHGTTVRKSSYGPPEVISKIPKLDSNNNPIPGEFVPVEFVITNDNIIKEKFEYTNSLDTNEDLAFCGCESAMVKFTIRNTKTYDEEKGIFVQDIPNLQTYVLTGEQQGNKDLPTLVGEIQKHYIIKVYIYFNGDSDSLIYLGMFAVEEDKVSSDGLTRDITALDFLYTLREMDIFNWYFHMFRGVNYKENDFDFFEGITDARRPSGISPEDWEAGWIKKPPENGKLTIKEMLEDLIKNLATRYPSDKTVTNRETQKFVDADGNETNYPTDDEEPYTGMAMPIVLDPDLFDSNKEYTIPTEVGPNNYECYGYMPILELPVYEDPKIMDAGSLSAGKFLEDIGALAGRYPYIRIDKIIDDDYAALTKTHPYNLYEKCILTFKPLPRKDDIISPDNYFDNHDIVKGFKHDYYSVDTIHVWELYTRFDETKKPVISYANLTKAQNDLKKDCPDLIKTLSVNGNIFIDYLAQEEKDVKIASKEPPSPEPNKADLVIRYKEVITILKDGKNGYNLQKDGDALLHDGYKKIKYRTYTPYELTTFADPVREVGDRIKINFEDKNTGEVFEFDTYILSRKISGIQKMMDTYVAKGNISNQTFSNYKTSTSYSPQSMGYYGSGGNSSNTDNKASSVINNITGLTVDDLCEYLRNIGFRLLNEPTKVGIVYNALNKNVSIQWKDPANITTNEPSQAEWAGTVVIRKEKSAPRNIYDGVVILNSVVRDQYKDTAYIDDTVEQDKTYYYGIFPYDTLGDVRFTKVVPIDTKETILSPEITDVYMGAPGDWDGSEVAIMWCGNNNKLTVQLSSGHIVFKMYIGSTEIYSFTSPVGTSASDTDTAKIHAAFLKDDTNEVAKPSFVYHTGVGVYSYNQEEPTDSEMEAIYSWLHPSS